MSRILKSNRLKAISSLEAPTRSPSNNNLKKDVDALLVPLVDLEEGEEDVHLLVHGNTCGKQIQIDPNNSTYSSSNSAIRPAVGWNELVRSLQSPIFIFLVWIGLYSLMTEFRSVSSLERRIDHDHHHHHHHDEHDGNDATNPNPFNLSPTKIKTEISPNDVLLYGNKNNKNVTNVTSSIVTGVELVGLPIPTALQFLRSSNIPLQESDVPYFFHIPRSAGATVDAIMNKCLGLTIASREGAGHVDDEMLKVYSSAWGSKYVNVDTTTVEGIVRAYKLSMVQSGQVGFVSTPFLYEGGYLFDADRQGRMFTMMRHPVDRAVSLFHFQISHDKNNTAGAHDIDLFSLTKWAHSSQHESNWVTRRLANVGDGDLLPIHLEIAKEVLRRFCIIGLLESKYESMNRILQYLNLRFDSDQSIVCKDRILHWGWKNKITYLKVPEESPVYTTLANLNSYDMELYEFAQQLFIHQEKLFE